MNAIDLSRGRRSGIWWRGPCPMCARRREHRRDDALAVRLDTGGFHCWRCEWKGRVSQFAGGVARSYDPDAGRRHALDLWDMAGPIRDGDSADLYLRARGLSQPAGGWPAELRLAQRVRHRWSGHVGPALIALVRDATGAAIAVQRLWLTVDGCKASIDPVRATLGSPRGGVVRVATTAETIAVAEGVETALAFAEMSGVGCWAALGASNFAHVVLPATIRSVIVVADRDPSGAAAAHRLADRLRCDGRRVRVWWPQRGDALDVLNAGGIRRGRR